MPFREYWLKLDSKGRGALAAACDTKRSYLSKLAYGHKNPSVVMMDLIAKATLGIVPRESWPARVVA